MMRKLFLAAVAALCVLGGGILVLAKTEPAERPSRELAGLSGDIDRGAYVARLAGCIGCHTDSRSGGAVLAGGAGIETDFGTFFAPNITPHPDDGIGAWTLEDFARALDSGLDREGRHYFPSFPYAFYTRLGDQDLVDLWAAVRSVPPVEGGTPPHDLGFPFGFRAGVGIWKRLFFEPGPLPAADNRPEEWIRGRYLARAPGHCGACHTPRNLLGGRQTGQRYEGGFGPGDEKIPPITPSELAAAGWTGDDLAYALRTGILPDGDVFGGSMAEVVRGGTAFWTDADLSALVTYIMDSETGE